MRNYLMRVLSVVIGMTITWNALAQIGRVGINTTTPKAMLHVMDSSVVFTGPNTFPGTGNPPVSGAGTRMMWFADKAAFRAGTLSGGGQTYWNKDSIGLYSVAMGYNTKAKANFSTAMGFSTTARGAISTATGGGTIASGSYSTAMGLDTRASGEYSTTFGRNTLAVGWASTSIGFETKAKSYASLAVGQFNDTTSTNSSAWHLTDPVFIIGNGTANNARANAMTVLKNGKTGINTAVPLAMFHVQDSSVLFGGINPPSGTGNPPVSGAGTRMMWYANKAAFRAGRVSSNQWDNNNIGTYSTAFGNNSTASGISSFAVGSATIASGDGAAAFGSFSKAIGDRSTAFGSSDAIGSYSTAMGVGSIANGFCSLVVGRFNDTLVAAQTTMTATTPLFTVGNGFLAVPLFDRSNAFVVLNNGNVGIGDINPSYRLHVGNNNAGSDGWSEGIMVENTNATPGEAAISFRNSAVPSDKQWIVGLNEIPPSLSFNYGNAFTSANTKVSLDTLGMLGIGTTSPDAHLHISKGTGGGIYNSNTALIIEDNASSYIQFSNPNNTQCGIVSGNEDDDIRSGILFFADSSITFRAGGDVTRATIENNGYFGIGTVSPDYLLEVNGTAGKPGGGSWTNSSDLRLKQNIHPYTEGLESILKINPITYQYNELSGYDTDPEYVGVVAQELKEIAPYMVSVSNKKTEGGLKDYLSVDNSAMTYMLINAVKELQQMISDQQETIDLLMKELSGIKSQLAAMNQEAGAKAEAESIGNK